MRLIGKFILRVAVNAAAIYAVAYYFSGFKLAAGWQNVTGAAVIMALAHAILKPILRLISFPFLILTLGLFNIVINFILLVIADYYSSAISIADLKTRFIASVIFGLVNSII